MKHLISLALLVICTVLPKSSFSQVFNSGIGLTPELNPDATLHLFGTGPNGGGSRLIFGDDLGSFAGVRTYIAEFGWQNPYASDSDILELHGENGIKFTIGFDKDHLIIPLEVTETGFTKLNMRDTIITAASKVVIQDDGTLAIRLPYQIGQYAQGGIVFWLDVTGEHGLVCDTADISSGVSWDNSVFRVTNATGDGVGAGKMNTMLIIAQQTADSPAGDFAALICANLTHGNLGDWYLPALYELSLMYINRSLLNMQPAPYWSSSEGVDVAAQVLDFATGTLYATTKDFQHRVRAIRAF